MTVYKFKSSVIAISIVDNVVEVKVVGEKQDEIDYMDKRLDEVRKEY